MFHYGNDSAEIPPLSRVSRADASVYVSEFVDALSAPIQFLSQAEMRAKQLEGLGINENDISDVSVPVRQMQEPLSVADRPQSPTVTMQSAPQSTGTGIQQAASDKDKKGATWINTPDTRLRNLYKKLAQVS